MRYILPILLGLFLGFLLIAFLPLIFAVFLHSWRKRMTAPRVAADHSPTDDDIMPCGHSRQAAWNRERGECAACRVIEEIMSDQSGDA